MAERIVPAAGIIIAPNDITSVMSPPNPSCADERDGPLDAEGVITELQCLIDSAHATLEASIDETNPVQYAVLALLGQARVIAFRLEPGRVLNHDQRRALLAQLGAVIDEPGWRAPVALIETADEGDREAA